ncbi:MAG: hypothetical protein V1792_25515 [Pseudomonadota bacterium]
MQDCWIGVAEKARALRELLEYPAGKGVVIGLENVTESAKGLEAVLSAVPDLRFTLDFGRRQLGTQVDKPVEIVPSLHTAILHVHLHDNSGEPAPAVDSIFRSEKVSSVSTLSSPNLPSRDAGAQ